jgi:hypothetical protein
MRSNERNIARKLQLLMMLAVAMGMMLASGSVVAAQSGQNEGVCAGDKEDVGGEQTSIVVSAPAGYLISQYCVKAGSIQQGDGPEYYPVNPPAPTVTISHSSGKAISHYSLTLVQIPTPTEVPPTVTPTDVPPTVTPTDVPPTATTVPGEPTPTNTPPTVTPTTVPGEPTKVPHTPEPAKDTPGVTTLPSTGSDGGASGGGQGLLLLTAVAATLMAGTGVLLRKERPTA